MRIKYALRRTLIPIRVHPRCNKLGLILFFPN